MLIMQGRAASIASGPEVLDLVERMALGELYMGEL